MSDRRPAVATIGRVGQDSHHRHDSPVQVVPSNAWFREGRFLFLTSSVLKVTLNTHGDHQNHLYTKDQGETYFTSKVMGRDALSILALYQCVRILTSMLPYLGPLGKTAIAYPLLFFYLSLDLLTTKN